MANILPEELNSEELAKRYAEALAELQNRKESDEAQGRRSAITDSNIESLAMDVAKARVGKKEDNRPGILGSLAKGLGSIPGALLKAAGGLESAKSEITDPTESNKKMKEVFGKYEETLTGPDSYQKMHEYQAGAKLPPVSEPKKADVNISRLTAEKPLIEDQSPAIPSPTKLKEAAPSEARREIKQASKTIENQIANIGGPKEEKDSFKERLKALQDTEDSYWNEYKTSKNRLEFMQAMEMVGLAFAQLGAGLQGQRTGVDLSGLKFNKVDWEKKIDNTLEELKQGLQRTSSAKKALAEEEQLAKRKEETAAERTWREQEYAKDRALREKELGAQKEAKIAAAEEKTTEARRKEVEKQMAGIEAMEQAIAQLESPDVSSKSKRELLDKLPALSKAAGVAVGVPAKTGGFLGLGQSEDFSKMKAELEGRRQSLLSGVQSTGGAKDPAIVNYANQYLQGDYVKAKEILIKRGYQPKEQ